MVNGENGNLSMKVSFSHFHFKIHFVFLLEKKWQIWPKTKIGFASNNQRACNSKGMFFFFFFKY